jgi:hypothetical protein
MSEYSDEEIEAIMQVGAFKKGQSSEVVRWVMVSTLGSVLSIVGLAIPSALFAFGCLVMMLGFVGLYTETKKVSTRC